MITFKQVSKRYSGGIEALSSVDFTLERGEMAFITGHSGAGKSTFLKLISMIEKPSSGDIFVNDTHLNHLNKSQIAKHRLGIGFTFQAPQLLQNKTIFENVSLPLLIQGLSGNMVTRRVSAALDMVGLLSKQKMYPQQLSAGEQQRVGIARSMVHKPALLLADEPTGNLDPTLAKGIMSLFEQFNQVGVSVLIVSHDLSLIANMKHRILVLRGGRLC